MFIWNSIFFSLAPSVPASPVIEALAPKFPAAAEEKLDAYERALRERQRECEERKRRLLESYQQVARCEAGKFNWD